MAKTHSQSDAVSQRALSPQWLVRMVALLVATSGIIALVQPLADRIPGRLQLLLLPFDYDEINRSATVFIGFVLIYFSTKLLQRKIVAWWTALVASTIIVVVQVLYAHSLIGALVPVLTIGALLATKDQFRVKSETESVWQGLRLLGLSLVVALLYGIVGFWLLEKRDFGHSFGLMQAINHTLRQYSLVGDPGLIPHTRQARWFLHSLDLFGAVSVGFGIYSLFRPLAYRLTTLPSEREEAEEILRLHSTSSEDFFKLWPEDKSYFFSPHHRAFLAYRVAAGVALVLGEPVGAQTELEPLVSQFIDFAQANGWVVALVDVAEDTLPLFEPYNLRTLKIGEDAIVNLDHFASEVATNKHFRHVRNRFTKGDYRFEVVTPPHERSLLTQIQHVSDQWLKLPGREERGFALGYFSRRYLSGMTLYVVRDPAGRIVAFANNVPTYRSPVATIDMMRHLADAPPNTMDYLFLEIMTYEHEQGTKQFSLGLVPLAGMDNGDERGAEERLLGYLYRGGRVFSFEGLRQFKNKFEPEWQPKFLVYSGGTPTLAQIALALSRVLRLK